MVANSVSTAGKMPEGMRVEVATRAAYWHDVPNIGPRGQLTFRDRTVCLAERDALLAGVFLYHFGSECSDLELLDRVWPEGATRWTLRTHLRRLDRRVGRVGLTIIPSANHGHSLRALEVG